MPAETAAPPWLSFAQATAALFAPMGAVARHWVSPRLAQAWAAALVLHWSRLERLGALDLSQPLYVLDLAPDEGNLAAGLLLALREELVARGMADWPVRYVLCPLLPEAAHAASARYTQWPVLHEFSACGWLNHATWPARTGQPMLLGEQRAALFGARNPMVALALGALSALPAELYGAHFGQLQQARVQLQELPRSSDEPKHAGLTLHYDWSALAALDDLATAPSVLLHHYRAGLISAPLLLSPRSLALLDALADFSGGRYLLLAVDHGVTHEQQIRLHQLAPPQDIVPGQLLLPVNFHALGLHQTSAGARVAQLQREELGAVLHLACRDDAVPPDDASWHNLVQRLDHAHPADRGQLNVTCPAVPQIDDINLYLRNAGYDPWALDTLLERLDLTQLQAASDQALASLHDTLAQTWGQLSSAQRQCSSLPLAELLCCVADWPLARLVLAHAPQATELTDAGQAQLLWLRVQLDLVTGHSASALQGLNACPQLTQQYPALAQLRQQLQERSTRRSASPWLAGDEPREGDLSLELLDALHIPAWLHQNRDPQIAHIAGLPPVNNEAQALDYLAEVASTDRAEYAVMHHQHGFIGVVGARRVDDMAHIHFWLGVDYQGQGLGTRAVQLLLRQVQQHRAPLLTHVFTSVLQDNLRSRRLLQRVGFSVLAHQGKGDDVEFLFLHLGLNARQLGAYAAGELEQCLVQVCEGMGEPLKS